MSSATLSIALEATALPIYPDFGCLLRRLGERRGLVALDSAGGEPSRWSLIAWEPLQGLGELPRNLLGLRQYLASAFHIEDGDVPGPFQGGFIGGLAYDSGVAGEAQRLPGHSWDWPALVGGVYTDFFVLDHAARLAFLVTASDRSPAQRAELLALASAASEGESAERDFRVIGDLRRKTSAAQHCLRVERAREEIAAGEYYQANIAHEFEADTQGDPLELYLRLRRVNPAPYMAYLRFEQGALLSASPELLLEVREGQMNARPIKGTAPRSEDAEEDERLALGLLASEKDRAELAMIVDLLRNDLGRVARVGSVTVADFPELRSYAGVHHLMADVHAELAADRDALDALLSVFPGGSITGAPKLRAMDAIAELEGQGRGYFTGSAGFLDVRGSACFNILIRTFQWRPRPASGPQAGAVSFHVGGGITWSSKAEEEERETLIKGLRLARALGFEWSLDQPDGLGDAS